MTVVVRSVRGLAFAALTFLSGCGICGCMSTPDIPAGQPFAYNGNTWRVSDDRSAGHLWISADDPRLAGLGTEAAARHQVRVMPEAEYRGAVIGWFATSGRFCTPDGGTASDDADLGGYSYTYTCWYPA